VTAATNGFTIAGTVTCTGTCTVEAVACNPGDAAPTTTEIEAGQCGGGNAALMNAQENWTTGVANDFLLTSTNKPARFNVYVSGTDGTNDTAVQPFNNQNRSADSGQEIVVMAAHSATGICNKDSYFNPDCADADVFENDAKTNESANCSVNIGTDGDLELSPDVAAACDGRQTFEISYQDVSSPTDGLFTAPTVGNFTTDDTVYINNAVPVCIPEPEDNVVVLTEDVAMATRDLDDLGGCTDLDLDTLTFTVQSGTLPVGTSLGGTGNKDWTGTPTTENEAGTAITVRPTDVAGDFADFSFTSYVVNTWTVPNLAGRTASQAASDIVAAAQWRVNDVGLSISALTCDPGAAGLVLTQSPAASSQAAAFAPIGVTLSRACSARSKMLRLDVRP